jgi:hypothetical protein
MTVFTNRLQIRPGLLHDDFSYKGEGRCEKRGWDKSNIPLRLVNIPTHGYRSSQKCRRVAVKKWDKKFIGTDIEESSPKSALGYVSFSKIK